MLEQESEACEEEDGKGFSFPESEPRSLVAGTHFLASGRDQLYQVTYRLATDRQIKALFRRKRPQGDLLQPSNFLGEHCYELWTKGSLAGLAVLSFSGMEFSDDIYLTVLLDAVYLAPSSRGSGLVYSFLADVARAAYPAVMAPLVGLGRTLPQKPINLTVTADLYSDGGQTAVRALGDAFSDLFSFSGLPLLDISVEDSNF